MREGVLATGQGTNRSFAAASIRDAYRLVGVYTGKILLGARHADLPVQQSPKLELIINLKTAKSLGIEIPAALYIPADECETH